MSEYFNSLDVQAKARYQGKLVWIDYLDPYTFSKEQLDFPICDLPEVHGMDIISYFVMRKSFYSENQIKAFKSLDAFKYYDAGFIQSIRSIKLNGHFLVIGEVKHGQKMSATNLKPWIILSSDGSIINAHCTYMAGLGEACSHIAAVAFAIHVRDHEVSVTEKLCSWKIPIVKNKIIPQRIKDIDWGKKINSYKKTKKLQNVPSLEGKTLIHFLTKIDVAEPSAAVLRVIQPFAKEKVPEVFVNLPKPLTSLFDPQYKVCSLEELRSKKLTFSITQQEQAALMKATLNQSKSYEWYKQCNGRITSSTFKSACTTSIENPSRTLINCVCYETKLSFRNKALAYGTENEENARNSYCMFMKSKHQNVCVKTTGFVISCKSSIFGSSIDAYITCDCCGTGCCEFKCPYRMHEGNLNMEQFINIKDCYIIKKSNGKLQLNRRHQYYFQVQMHMYCTETDFCDFVVWSRKEMYIERITIDTEFLELNLQKAKTLHANVIVPELLSKCYTEPTNTAQIMTWCLYRSPDNEEPMIKCSNDECSIKWFHVRCVMPGSEVDELEWYCDACSGKTLDPMDWENEE